jgi:hypothetical protein
MKSFVYYLKEEHEKPNRINEFIKFAAEQLGVEQPNVVLLDAREPGMTTASYNMRTGEIKVYVKGRASFDICRSIAHEMVHAAQHTETEDLDGSTGSPHENQANALAGQIVRMFGKLHDDFYEK